MTRPLRIFAVCSWVLLVSVALAWLVSSRFPGGPFRRPAPATNKPVIGQAPVFALTDQDGRAFTPSALRGRVWVADFIFTRCPGPCVIMAGKMQRIQAALRDADLQMVSFSVDPEYDTPAVLKAYAREWDAGSRWTFLTGEFRSIADVAHAFLTEAAPASAGGMAMHSTQFFLVDGAGNVRGPYSGVDEEGWQELVADAKAVGK
jgi:cytochrome oxidase Cu insertion factor (SCO1/SenC/PrrC family)